MTELKETVGLMESKDYKERFRAEYWQTKIRYEKLKAFNTKIRVAQKASWSGESQTFSVDMPKHDSPIDLLSEQQRLMGDYLRVLEERAVFEGISL